MMDQFPNTLFNNYMFLKRILQFVFSVSVLSFFLCCSSGFSVHHPQYFNAYFSSCLFSMFTHTLERKYMFLICNGILAFLAKNSLMASSSSSTSSPHNMSSSSPSFDDMGFQSLETKTPPVSDIVVLIPHLVVEEEEQVLDHQVKIMQEEEHYEEEEDSNYRRQNQGREINEAGISSSEEDEIEGSDEKQEEKEGGITESDEAMVTHDDDDDDGTTMVTTNELEAENTDELNRKFEEFIRKMKEEIRIEAQRPLIAV